MKKTILNMLGQLLADFLEQAGFAHRKQTVGDGLRSPKEKQRIVEGVRKFFDENYELRYNVMKQAEEFRPHRQQEPVFCQQEPVNFQKEADNFQKEADNFRKEAPNFGKGAPAGQGMPPWKPLTDRELRRMALLVNIDEYNAKTDREQAKIKRVLTEKDVQTRRMRSDQYELRPRMASFIATTNEQEPLCDATGSRRYLCCEVTGIIETEEPVPYQQMYAQAVAELRQGARWHSRQLRETENGSANRCDTDT